MGAAPTLECDDGKEMAIQDRGTRVGLIEIGSRSVRYMVARFDRAGAFQIDQRGKDSFAHGIDVDNLDDVKVEGLWAKVEAFNEDLKKIRCDRTWIYGTELCRRLEKLPGQRLPSFVTVLSIEQEAVAAWTAGFLSANSRSQGQRCTVVDQGGGSTELISATWSGRTVANWIHESFDLGSTKLATLYSRDSDEYVSLLRPLLEGYSDKIKVHETKTRTEELVLLGGVATKLAFNIKHKRHDDDVYNPRITDKTRLSVSEIADYYYNTAKIYKKEPERARYLVDRRTVDTDEYEIVMSGAILLMLIALRLGHQQVTVSVNSTRYGMGFLVARGLI
jgi:exopolyphosphatase/pppGpp-phosphohydrolase